MQWQQLHFGDAQSVQMIAEPAHMIRAIVEAGDYGQAYHQPSRPNRSGDRLEIRQDQGVVDTGCPAMKGVVQMFDIEKQPIDERQGCLKKGWGEMAAGLNGGMNICGLTALQYVIEKTMLHERFTAAEGDAAAGSPEIAIAVEQREKLVRSHCPPAKRKRSGPTAGDASECFTRRASGAHDDRLVAFFPHVNGTIGAGINATAAGTAQTLAMQ